MMGTLSAAIPTHTHTHHLTDTFHVNLGQLVAPLIIRDTEVSILWDALPHTQQTVSTHRRLESLSCNRS